MLDYVGLINSQKEMRSQFSSVEVHARSRNVERVRSPARVRAANAMRSLAAFLRDAADRVEAVEHSAYAS
jgi:hypothetical protein